MSSQEVSGQSQSAHGARAVAPPSLPDLNAQTYPFEMVLHLLDQAAFLNSLAIPDHKGSGIVIRSPGNTNVIGMDIRGSLHRFQITLLPPAAETGVRALDEVGEKA